MGRRRHSRQFCEPIDGCEFCRFRLKVLRAIAEEGGVVPSMRAIGRKLHCNSVSKVRAAIHWLEAGGYLTAPIRYERGREITERGREVLRRNSVGELVVDGGGYVVGRIEDDMVILQGSDGPVRIPILGTLPADGAEGEAMWARINAYFEEERT